MRTTINGALVGRLLDSGAAVRQLVHYFDVWGNEHDGYQVNNLCKEPIYIIGDTYTNADLLRSLRRVGFLAPRLHFTVDDFMTGEEIWWRGVYPVCRTELDLCGWATESLREYAEADDLRQSLEKVGRFYSSVGAVVLLGGDVAGFDPMQIGGDV